MATVRLKDGIAWSPQPGPQQHLISCSLPDCFFGGQRGGGKSDGLLGDFAVREGRYGEHLTGLLCRRTYPELGDLIERSHEIYGRLGWKYTGGDERSWRSPRGALLRFRHLDTIADARLYKGFNNQWLGFDELDEWPDPRPLDMLFATLRSKHGVPCVRRCTGNPGGPGNSWIKKRYRPHLWRKGQPYIYTRYQPQPEERPDLWVDAVYIPSRLEDNVYLPPGYEANLAISAGSPQLFRAWRYGDWSVQAGTYFDIFDPALHVTTRAAANIQPWDPKWISMDWGFSDDSAIHWHSSNEEKRIVTYQELVTNRKTPRELGELIAERCVIGRHENDDPIFDNYADFVMSRDAFGVKESERTIADELGDVVSQYGIPRPRRAIMGPGTKVPGLQLMYQMLKTGYWKITKDCPDLIESLPLLVRDDSNPEDVADHPRDHSPDSARYGLTSYPREAREPVELRAARLVTSKDPTARAIQGMKAEAMIRKAKQPVRFPTRRRFY